MFSICGSTLSWLSRLLSNMFCIYLVCGNTMCVSTCQVDFVLKRTVVLYMLLPRSGFAKFGRLLSSESNPITRIQALYCWLVNHILARNRLSRFINLNNNKTFVKRLMWKASTKKRIKRTITYTNRERYKIQIHVSKLQNAALNKQVFNRDLLCTGRLFQRNGAAYEKDLWP